MRDHQQERKEMKKEYSLEEKIKYYERLVERQEAVITLAQHKLIRYKERLEYLMSEQYQDWDSDLQKELDKKKGS